MRNKIAIVAFTLICSVSLSMQAQDVIKSFIDMPGNLLPTFDKTLKLELVENYIKNNRKDSVVNSFGGKARMIALDTLSNYLQIQPTSISRMELKIFEREDKTWIVGIINTVCSPICSSYINFYDSNWNEIDVKLPEIKIEKWFNKSAESNVDLNKKIRVFFYELRFSPNKTHIEVINNSLLYLGEEDQLKLKDCFKPGVVLMEWDLKANWKYLSDDKQ